MQRYLTVLLSVLGLALLANGQIPGHLVSPCTEEFQILLDSFGATIGANGDTISHIAHIQAQNLAQIRRRNETGFYPVFSTINSYGNQVISDGNTAVIIGPYSQILGFDALGNVSTTQNTPYYSNYGRFDSPTRITTFGLSSMNSKVITTWNFTTDGWNKTHETDLQTTQLTTFMSSRQNAFWDKYFFGFGYYTVPFNLSIYVQLPNLDWTIETTIESEDIDSANQYNLMGYDGENTIIASLFQSFNVNQTGGLIIYTKNGQTWNETQRITVADLGVTGPGNAGSSFLMINKNTFLWGVPQERDLADNAVPTGKVFIFSRQQNNTWAPIFYLYSDLNVAFGIGLAANDIDVLIGGFTIGPPPYIGNFFAMPKCFFGLNVTCHSKLAYNGACNADTPVDLSAAYTVNEDASLGCGQVNNATLESFSVISETEINAVVRITKNGFIQDCPVTVTCPMPPQPPVAAPVATPVKGAPKPTSAASHLQNHLQSFIMMLFGTLAISL